MRARVVAWRVRAPPGAVRRAVRTGARWVRIGEGLGAHVAVGEVAPRLLDDGAELGAEPRGVGDDGGELCGEEEVEDEAEEHHDHREAVLAVGERRRRRDVAVSHRGHGNGRPVDGP